MSSDTPVWMGSESEYAVMRAGNTERGQQIGHALLEFLQQKLEWLPDGTNNGFMCPFGRCYIDGTHPEISISPTSNPWDAISNLTYLQSLVVQFAKINESRFWLTRCNVDYLNGTTWGNHDCYSLENTLGINPKHIIPFIVTRSLFCGAGGFTRLNNDQQVTFCLSPRAYFVRNAVGSLPLWHVKADPSLASRQRIHLYAGENLCSPLANALKLGTTSLVLALAAGNPEALSSTPKLADPVQAIKQVSTYWPMNYSCPIQTKDGSYVEAIHVQGIYANAVRENAKDPYMPPWADWLATLWGEVLVALENNDLLSCSTYLDWAAKHVLFEKILHDRGYSMGDLSNHALPDELLYHLYKSDSDWGQLTEDGIGHRFSITEKAQLPFTPVQKSTSAPSYPLLGMPKQRSDAIRDLASSDPSNFLCNWHNITNQTTGKSVHTFKQQNDTLNETKSIMTHLEKYCV